MVTEIIACASENPVGHVEVAIVNGPVPAEISKTRIAPAEQLTRVELVTLVVSVK